MEVTKFELSTQSFNIMETQTQAQILTREHLLKHWQGHRDLTRRVIQAFPEKEFFEFSIGGMRTGSQLIAELIAIAGPGIKAIAEKSQNRYDEGEKMTSKEQYLHKWDEATKTINHYWQSLEVPDFAETFNLFGEYEFPVIDNILYFIDNEIHHRGQMYVYLRALGIEPPAFWDRPH